ncbi:hypothetical protein Tco_0261733 [Tanacetum coccineum]
MSELCNLKNTVSINCSLQNEIIRVNLENESLKDEISDLKKALGGRGKRNEKISSKEVIFMKADESSYVLKPEITFDSESECNNHEPPPPLSKLIKAKPTGTSKSLISLADLTLNMADVTLNTNVPKKVKQTSNKVSPAYVIKTKTETKAPSVLESCSDKKADSFPEKLLLTLMEEVMGLIEQIKTPSCTSLSVCQSSSSKSAKQKTCFGPCKHCGLRNHLSNDCYTKCKCSTCGSTNHMTKEHPEQDAIKKTLNKLKARSSLNPSSKKAPMILKLNIKYGKLTHCCKNHGCI